MKDEEIIDRIIKYLSVINSLADLPLLYSSKLK